MRIDSSVPPLENQPTSQVGSSSTSSSQTRTGSVSPQQDQAQLSVDSGTMQSLKASLSQLPEVRQDRVDALRQAVSSGTYQVTDQQLSDAMGSDLMAGPARLA